jgi:hypothetical protein
MRAWAAAITLFACAPSTVAPTGAALQDGGADAVDSARRPVATCLGAPPAADGLVCVETVSGTAVELAGAGVGQATVTLCGSGTCFGANTDAVGAFSIRAGAQLNVPAYRVHLDGRPNFVDNFATLDARTGPNFQLGSTLRTARLPASGPVLASPASGVAEFQSNSLQVRIAARTELDFGFANLSEALHGSELRVVDIPIARISDFGPFDYLAGVSPFGTVLSVPAGVTIDLPAALAPLAPIEFLVMQDDYLSPELGRMVVAAKGHVSASGKQASTDEGQGISRLTWLAVRVENSGK